MKEKPEITFTFKSASKVKKVDDSTQEFEAVGEFSCNGVTKELTVPVRATYQKDRLGDRLRGKKGDILVLRTNFSIKRSDFKIKPDAGEPKPISPEGIGIWAVSPDGSAIAAQSPDATIRLYPIDGSAPREVPGLTESVTPVGWIADGLLVMGDADRARGAHMFFSVSSVPVSVASVLLLLLPAWQPSRRLDVRLRRCAPRNDKEAGTMYTGSPARSAA